MMLRNLNDPEGDGWVLYSRFAEERIRSVVGGSEAGDRRRAFETIDPPMSRGFANDGNTERRRRRNKWRIMVLAMVMTRRKSFATPINIEI